MDKKLINLFIFLVLIIGVFLLFLNRKNEDAKSFNIDQTQGSGVKGLQGGDVEPRSTAHDRDGLHDVVLNRNRRRVKAWREAAENSKDGPVIKVKTNAVVESGESLITLQPYGSDGGVVMTAHTVTVVKVEGAPDMVRFDTRTLTAGSDFVSLNKMGDFQDNVGAEDQYVEAWSADEYQNTIAQSGMKKGTDIMVMPSVLVSSSDAASVSIGKPDRADAVRLDFTAEIQENGSIHILSEFIVENE